MTRSLPQQEQYHLKKYGPNKTVLKENTSVLGYTNSIEGKKTFLDKSEIKKITTQHCPRNPQLTVKKNISNSVFSVKTV